MGGVLGQNVRVPDQKSIKETMAQVLVGMLCVGKTRKSGTSASTLRIRVVKPGDTPIQLSSRFEELTQLAESQHPCHRIQCLANGMLCLSWYCEVYKVLNTIAGSTQCEDFNLTA